MNRKLITILIANLFAVPAVYAADPINSTFTWSGEVSAGAMGATVNSPSRNAQDRAGTNDPAKANEYRDLYSTGFGSGSLTGGFDLAGRGDRYYMNAFGENLNRQDQYLNLQGGMYDTFKYRVFDDRMVHNLSWNLLTPFYGAGSTVLSSFGGAAATGLPGGPDANPNNWNLYDAALKKENMGGYFEYKKDSPWYFRLDANQATTKGIQAASSPNTLSAGGGSIDLPMPIDYKTQNYSLETGWNNKRGLINASFSQSFFTNGNTAYYWQDPRFGNGITANMEAANSILSKVGINGSLRQLPLNSTLSSRISYSQLTNSIGLGGPYVTNLTAVAGATPVYTSANPSASTADNKIVTSNANFSLTSNPYKNLDTRLYWNWYHRDNQSPLITYVGSPLNSEGYNYGKFQYRKNNYGIDTGYRINPDNKIGLGASQTAVERSIMRARPINEPGTTIDNTYYAEYRNTSLEQLTGVAKYERVNRMSGDWADSVLYGAAAINPAYSRPMDTANYHQDRLKLGVDANPAALLDTGFQAIFKQTNYDASNYGLKSDKRQEYTANATYGDPSKFRISAWADYELVQYVDYWFVGGLQGPNSVANYNLNTNTRAANKMFGLGGDWPVTEKFKMNASYLYVRATGGVDFQQNSPAQTPNASGNITTGGGLFAPNGTFAGNIVPYNTENSTKQSLSLSGKYTIDKNWSVSGGYAYEKYTIRDDQMNGWSGNYIYYAAMGGALNSTFSGAFQNPSYTAQIVRLMANYKF